MIATMPLHNPISLGAIDLNEAHDLPESEHTWWGGR